MDPLTHSATGLFLSRAGLKRYCEQAPWLLVLAANAPDIDILTRFGGSLSYLNYHRHLTHALIAMPVMALLPVLLIRLFTRKPFRWKNAFLISLIAVATHLLLDWTNVYGIRLLLPFSARWCHLDFTAVADLWIWLAFLVALAGPALARLVNSEIGARTHTPGRGFAIFALLFLLVYNAGRGLLHARVVATLDSRIYAGQSPQRILAIPGAVNPIVWRGLVELPGFYSLNDVNLLDEFDPARGTIFYKPEPNPALQAANQSPEFRDFLRFSLYPFERISPVGDPPNGNRVEAMDLRFATPAHPSFLATALVDSGNRVTRAWFVFGSPASR